MSEKLDAALRDSYLGDGEPIDRVQELFRYCVRTTGYMAGLADRLNYIAKAESELLNKFAETLDDRRCDAERQYNTSLPTIPNPCEKCGHPIRDHSGMGCAYADCKCRLLENTK